MSTGIARPTVTKVAASSSCQSSRRLAITQAASGRKSATSSGRAWGAGRAGAAHRHVAAGGEVGRAEAERERLRDEREGGRGDDEGDRQRARPVVDPAVEPGVALGLDRERGAGDEPGDAGEAVQGEHERVAPQHLADDAEVRRTGEAREGRGERRIGRQLELRGPRRPRAAAPRWPARRPARGAAPARAPGSTRAAWSGCGPCPGRARDPRRPPSCHRSAGARP